MDGPELESPTQFPVTDRPRALVRPVRVQMRVRPEQLKALLQKDARQGLWRQPKIMPPRWFYDARGARLFELITNLPEYYPTRTERTILAACAGELAFLTRAQTLVELGSGSSKKTRLLLDALVGEGCLRRYVAVDICEPQLLQTSLELSRQYPGLEVHALVADFETDLAPLPREGACLFAFLGGTLGNLEPAQRERFYAGLREHSGTSDWLLLGVDLLKDRGRLQAAYDDAAGITALFNLNLLHVLNRELGASFPVEAFEHVACFDEEQRWMELSLRARRPVQTHVAALGARVEFAAGEAMRTEVSCKFTQSQLEEELGQCGFRLRRWWTDPALDFAVLLASPVQ